MNRLEEAARSRIEQCRDQINRTMKMVWDGIPLAAEPDPDRAVRRVQAMTGLSREVAMATQVGLTAPPSTAPLADGREIVRGATIDFVGVAFLERGWHTSRAVGRVAHRSGQPRGSGFLVAPGLFLTNNHVIESASACEQFALEFDYELDATGMPRRSTRFALDPQRFFLTDDINDLDYTLVAVGPRLSGEETLDTYGFCPLSDADDKHALGEVANVIQHPDGRLKEVVLRENRLVSRLTHVLHYIADTEGGSSGSPVFNNEWRVIALHHWGGPWRQSRDSDGRLLRADVNEGIRISAIVRELRDRRTELAPTQRRMLDDALRASEATGGAPLSPSPSDETALPRVRVQSNGTVTWHLPVEISVAIPSLQAAHALPVAPPSDMAAEPDEELSEAFRRELDRNYGNRKGFRERFIPGHEIKMPRLSESLQNRAAENLDAEPGDNPFEFPYQHFSVVVDRTRRLPLLTACNIDGKNSKSINRETGAITHSEGLAEAEESGPEGRERWYEDPRISPNDCTDDSLYVNQQISLGPNRTGRIFHRGHMVRRLDPVWGRDDRALRAEADTFHFTNCTPQVGKFNAGKRLWQGIENYVLDNARSEDKRVCVFTGPVLDDDNDPPYREHFFPGFKVPLLFWKVIVWNDSGSLAALAMLADQEPVLREMPEATGPEDFHSVADVEEFITTITEIERLTDLDFGKVIRDADLYTLTGPEGTRHGKRKRVINLSDISLVRGTAKRPRRRGSVTT